MQTDKKNSTNRRLKANVAGLAAVFVFMAIAALMHNGRILGFAPGQNDRAATTTAVKSDSTVVINTTAIGKDITGYSGQVPVEITITGDKVVKVRALDNTETPSFFKRVEKSGLLSSWDGLDVRSAAALEVDAVSGATYSSKAVIANVKAGLADYMHSDAAVTESGKEKHPAEFYIALAVVIAAMSIPLFMKKPAYRVAQQVLNTAVLGFWGGMFVDYTMMLNIMSGGASAVTSITALLMLIAAFIYPLFGKDGYYCAWVCPLGSLQELASRCNSRHHITLPKRVVKILTRFRMILWATLMVMLWTGIWMSWIDYELFTAFMIGRAPIAVTVAGAVIVVISLFIPRPYCRFICPTGTLLRMSQDIDTK